MISKKYNQILLRLEKNIKDKNDFNLAKSALSDLAICYIDEITKLEENYNFKISGFEERLETLENKVFLGDEQEDVKYSEEIECPYCGVKIDVEYDETQTEISCPNCKNSIELDWGEFDDM